MDFAPVSTGDKLLAILSIPHTILDKNILSFLRVFNIQVWICLILSYFLFIILNTLCYSWKIKIYIAIDYMAILLGKGIFNMQFCKIFMNYFFINFNFKE